MNRLKSPQFLLTLILIEVTCLTALVIATGYVLTRQNAATERLNSAIRLSDTSHGLAGQLRQSSDDLTRMVRTYAATGDSRFEEYFYTILNIRDGKAPRPEGYDRIFWDFKVAEETEPNSEDGERISLRTLMEQAGFADEELELLAEAKSRSDKLVEMEEIAMNAMKGRFRDDEGAFSIQRDPDRELALQILFSKEYHQAKNDIMKPVNDFLIASDNRTSQALAVAQEESRSLSLALNSLLGGTLVVLPLFIFTGYRYHGVSHSKLREREERFHATFEQAAVGIAHVSPEGNFLLINKKFCDIVGYSREEMLKLTFQEITHPDDLDADVTQVNQLLAGEIDTYSMEKRYFRKNGEITWIHLTVSLVRNEAQEPQWFVGVVKDINERKQAEEHLRKSEEKFRTLVTNIPDVIWTTDSNGNTTFISSNIERIYGYSPEEIYARSGELWLDRIHHEDVEYVKHAFAVLFETGSQFDIEYRIKKKDGEWIWLHDRSIATHQKDGIMYADGILTDITERKQAAAELRRSEELFRGFMEQSPMAIEMLTPDGKICQVNSAWRRLWDLSYEETAQVMEHYNVLADKQARELGVANLVRKSFEGEAVILPPFQYALNLTMDNVGLKHITGKSPWVHCHLYPIKNPAGEVMNVALAILDVTELKEMESELRKSEAHLLRAQEVANAGSWELDILNGSLFWSAEVYRIFGTPPGEPLNYEAFLERVLPEERAYVDQSWQAAIQGAPYDIEHRILADGQIKWVREKARVEFDETGQAITGVGIVQDITERKRAELQVSEMASFAELNPAPVLRVNPDGIIMSCNPASVEILGTNAKEGTPITSILPDLSGIDLDKCIHDNLLLSQEVDIEGRSYLFILRGVSDLNLLHIYGSDITERKQSEKQLDQMRSELVHATRTGIMGEMTAALAHELNHPLGSILNNANAARRFLEQDNPDLDEIRDIIADIISEDRRASEVMQKVRALMKKTEVGFAPVKINGIIEEVIKLTQSEFIIENVSLSKQLGENLPQVAGERVQLQQVFINLIMNAIDAMKQSTTKRLHISSARHDAETIMIRISDTGAGFADEDKNSLFKPFFTTKTEGMGMGLSVTQTIIKSHGGEICADNNNDAGASFYITLPVYKERSFE